MKINLNFKLNSIKLNKNLPADLPMMFEKYEIFVVISGIIFVFLFAGFLFYEKAYKATIVPPEVFVDVPKVNTALFEKTVEELEQRKQTAPDLPIIDPFQ